MEHTGERVDERDIILTSKCQEPEGEVIRSVRLAELSFEKIKFFWDKMKDFDLLFNDFVRGDFRAFMNHFVVTIDGEPSPAGLIFEVDDVGIFILNELRPMVSCQAHFVFWDRRFVGRDELCRKGLEYAFEKYKFVRIEVNVPLCSPNTIHAMERVGMFLEGRKRDSFKYKGEWYDVNIYSVIPEDMKDQARHNKNKIRTICTACGDKFVKIRTPKPRENVTHGA